MPLLPRLKRLAELVAAALFIAMFAAFLLQVFMRYVLNDPVTWTQEFVVVVYVWIVFWCGAALLHERDHITFEMVSTALPPGARRRLAIVTTALVGVAFLAALPKTIDYIAFMKIEKSPVLGVRLDILHSIFGLFVLAVAVGAGLRIRRLLGRAWEEEIKTGGELQQ